MSPRVLVVDDEKYICSILKDYLEESGYHVSTAFTLASARLEVEKSELFDAMVVDFALPDGNGLELLKEIRSGARNETVPFLLITAHVHNKVDPTVYGCVPDDIITKPFNLTDFKVRLEQQLDGGNAVALEAKVGAITERFETEDLQLLQFEQRRTPVRIGRACLDCAWDSPADAIRDFISTQRETPSQLYFRRRGGVKA